jgi:hypothetical protein
MTTLDAACPASYRLEQRQNIQDNNHPLISILNYDLRPYLVSDKYLVH